MKVPHSQLKAELCKIILQSMTIQCISARISRSQSGTPTIMSACKQLVLNPVVFSMRCDLQCSVQRVVTEMHRFMIGNVAFLEQRNYQRCPVCADYFLFQKSVEKSKSNHELMNEMLPVIAIIGNLRHTYINKHTICNQPSTRNHSTQEHRYNNVLAERKCFLQLQSYLYYDSIYPIPTFK